MLKVSYTRNDYCTCLKDNEMSWVCIAWPVIVTVVQGKGAAVRSEIRVGYNMGEGLEGGGGVWYSLFIKKQQIILLIKILGYSLKSDQLFIKSKKGGKAIRLFTIH